MHYQFKTRCHPAADGRQPQVGDQSAVLQMPLDDGRVITLHLGIEGLINIGGWFLAMVANNPEMLIEAEKRARQFCSTTDEGE